MLFPVVGESATGLGESISTLIIAFDNDEKGREAAVKVVIRLRGKHKVIRSFLQE